MDEELDDPLAHLWTDDQLTRALGRGLKQAVERHRRLGFPMVGWREGQVVIIPPEELPRYEEDAGAG